MTTWTEQPTCIDCKTPNSGKHQGRCDGCARAYVARTKAMSQVIDALESLDRAIDGLKTIDREPDQQQAANLTRIARDAITEATRLQERTA